MKKIRINNLFLSYISIMIILISISYAIVEYYTNEDYLQVDIIKIVNGNQILFGNKCTAIIATTSPERAYSIQLALEKRYDQRPTTHDSFSDVLNSFNITLERVNIERFDGQFYYSNMILKQNKNVLELDTKPSDAIAIAIRLHAPIYVNKTLLEEQGQNIC
ncbi:MAG: bifunctional nuclease family protein [Candidatus Aenigmarchaeota archaeon]|nr:bifunctional nuclease family protein [Candidatus Aenigmarchaeota archaeon]